jgi:neopullulanase
MAAASVSKVDPPGWWVSHTINPVRVMVTGSNLSGPIRSHAASLKPGTPKISEDRRYAFFDLTIAPETAPGMYQLDMADATVAFEVLAPLPGDGRFAGFSQDDVLYLILPDRFSNGDAKNDGPLTDRGNPRAYHGGDLAGILQRLSYFKDLGITALWIAPIYDNANVMRQSTRGSSASYHGYGAVDLYRVEEQFGNMQTFRDLVNEAHRLGLKVILDQVANHVGAEHPWVEAPPTPTWFHGTAASHAQISSEMWTLIDPYRSSGLSQRLLEGWFGDRLPDLNQDDPEVERYLIQNTLWWIGMSGIDGVREDTVGYVPKQFWRKWMQAIKRQYPRFEVVGEVYNRDPIVVAHFQDTGMRLFDFPLQEALTSVFIDGEDLPDIPAVLARDKVYLQPNRLVTFFGMHDVRRFREKGSPDALKNTFHLLLTMRGTPLIYYGDEIAMQGGGDPDNRRDFPGGWDGDARNAFVPNGRTREEQDVFTHVQALLRLRAQYPALRRGRLINLEANDDAYVYARTLYNHESVVVSLGKGARFELRRAPWLSKSTVLKDSLGSAAVLRRVGTSVEISGAGVFVVGKTTTHTSVVRSRRPH